MKQVPLRLEDSMHNEISDSAARTNSSLQQHIVQLIFNRGDIYRTNLDGRIQLRVNLTYLGDLLVLGRISSFNGVYAMMEEALHHKEQVIIEKHYTNALPQHMKTFEMVKDLEKWRDAMNNDKSK
ncbi:hypothetical protein [Paenibacillus sp. MER 99-2]|uniref:hypothetical protein n=1 Tax=Paenibacillus sp. MER 99-2 TaxID=2939572 RepID=UPI0020416BEB|nr:hypothetical protein [Paenibacillus sp. MER 99-2]MCM3174737.1 hypothetical protein [Paenibacillus sp. MER 99-2]